LPHQRVDRVELQFVADEGDEGDIECRSIEIALEIEQEYFQQRRAIVEGRAAAEAGDAIKALGTPADPHRIDAVLEAAVLVEADIGCGITELAAAFLAMDHLAGNEPRATQHRGGVFDLPSASAMRIALEDTGRSSISTCAWTSTSMPSRGASLTKRLGEPTRPLPK